MLQCMEGVRASRLGLMPTRGGVADSKSVSADQGSVGAASAGADESVEAGESVKSVKADEAVKADPGSVGGGQVEQAESMALVPHSAGNMPVQPEGDSQSGPLLKACVQFEQRMNRDDVAVMCAPCFTITSHSTTEISLVQVKLAGGVRVKRIIKPYTMHDMEKAIREAFGLDANVNFTVVSSDGREPLTIFALMNQACLSPECEVCFSFCGRRCSGQSIFLSDSR